MNAVGRRPFACSHGWIACACLLLGSACASRGAIDTGRTDAGFREIQRYEARIDAARVAVEQGASGERAREKARDAQAAAEALCTRAQELADADALTRCERARAQADALSDRVASSAEDAR